MIIIHYYNYYYQQKFQTAQIHKKHVQDLLNGEMLHFTLVKYCIIMYYFYLVDDNYRDEIYIITNTFFAKKLVTDTDVASNDLNEICSPEDLLKHQMIIVPIFGDVHFGVIVIVNPNLLLEV
jgi:hypothetical protein